MGCMMMNADGIRWSWDHLHGSGIINSSYSNIHQMPGPNPESSSTPIISPTLLFPITVCIVCEFVIVSFESVVIVHCATQCVPFGNTEMLRGKSSLQALSPSIQVGNLVRRYAIRGEP